MAAITWDDVVAFEAGLASVSDIAQAIILADVNAALDVRRFDGESDPRLKMARIALAMHFAELSADSDAEPGPVASEAAGSMSVSYDTGPTAKIDDVSLNFTKGGRLYRFLIRRAGGGCAL